MTAKASGQRLIEAERERVGYVLTCTAGDAIPVTANGSPKVTGVSIEAWRQDEAGALSVATGDMAASVRNSAGSELRSVSGSGTGSLSVRMALVLAANANPGSARTVEATLAVEGKTVARKVFSLAYEGAQGEPGADGVARGVWLSTGATLPCTAYAEVKDAQVTCGLEEDGQKAGSYGMDLLLLSADGSQLYATRMGGVEGLMGYDCTFVGGKVATLAPAKMQVKIYGAPVGQELPVLAEQTFAITYDTPVPHARTEQWSAGLTYRNGDMILYGADGEEKVYVWNWPAGGNSTLNPLADVQQNPATTHWAAYEQYALLATRVLMATWALLGSAVFHGDWMISQHGTVGGAESTDYTRFDWGEAELGGAGFVPNIMLDFKTGNGSLGGGRLRWNRTGVYAKHPIVPEWVGVTEYAGGKIDFTKGGYIDITYLYGTTPTEWELGDGPQDGYSVAIRYRRISRSDVCATIKGKFYYPGSELFAGLYSTKFYCQGSGLELELRYHEAGGRWEFVLPRGIGITSFDSPVASAELAVDRVEG